MKHASLLAALATLAMLFASALPAPQSPASASLPNPPCPNPLPHEPVVVYEVTGGTLSGPVDYALTVYGDGAARLSSALGGGGTGSSQYTFVDPSAAAALRQELVDASALARCDQDDNVSDTPLQTLTVFRAGSTRRSNTFSWFTSDGSLAQIQAALDAFIAKHFAPLPGGGGS
jgi:hypothetical protein